MLEFPSNPADGETVYQSDNGVTYQWNAADTRWESGGTTGSSLVSGTIVQDKVVETAAALSTDQIVSVNDNPPSIGQGSAIFTAPLVFVPKYAGSLIRVQLKLGVVAIASVNVTPTVWITRNSEADAVAATSVGMNNGGLIGGGVIVEFEMVAPSLDPISFNARFAANNISGAFLNSIPGTGRVYGGSSTCRLTATEIQPNAVVPAPNAFPDYLAGYENTGTHSKYAGDLDNVAVNSTYQIVNADIINGPSDWLSGDAFLTTFCALDLPTYATQIIYGRTSTGRWKQWMRHADAGVWAAWTLVVDGSATEGFWTPTVSDSSGNDATHSVRWGEWKRDGRMVTFWGHVVCTSVAGVSGTVRIKGLPFLSSAANVNARYGATFTRGLNLALTAGTYITGQILDNNAHFTIREWNLTTGTGSFTNTNLTNTAELNFSGSYMTDEP